MSDKQREVPAAPANTPKWANQDAEAKKEQKNWDELDDQRLKNDLLWLGLYGRILAAITLLFAVVFAAAFLAWAWHYITPTTWHWLSSLQLGKIQSILFSGGLGAVVSSAIGTQLKKAK